MRSAWVHALAAQNLVRVQHEDAGMLVARKVGDQWVRVRVRNQRWCPVKKTLDGYADDGDLSPSFFELCRFLHIDLQTGALAVT